MIRRPPRSTLDRSSAASDGYKRQALDRPAHRLERPDHAEDLRRRDEERRLALHGVGAVSYTHLRAHETVLDIVCRLLLEKKNPNQPANHPNQPPTHNT